MMILKNIENFVKILLEKTEGKKIHLVSHFDTDGITSAAIFSKTLERLNKQFSLKILKQLTEEEINLFPKDKAIILLDLGSNSLEPLSKLDTEVFIIDHHEIDFKPFDNLHIFNPHLFEEYENLCGAELAFLISKNISEENKSLAYLAVIGMVGDTMEKNITKTRNSILKETKIKIKKGLLIYPSTRPLDKALEYNSHPFIPGVTGDSKGTYELLREANIEKINKKYKALIDLSEPEMKSLVTAVMLRLSSKEKKSNYIGNLYLIKFFNKIEDAREISAMINACSRMDQSGIALMLCLGNNSARKKAEKVYVKYRQAIISGLKYIDKSKKIQGREFVIIHGKDKIKDTIIGTLTSILSFSSTYPDGTILISMTYTDNEQIKISARISGRKETNRNLKELMDSIVYSIGGESGGHKMAAGCTIKKENENKFIELIKKKLEFELIKV
ncbi:DHH family phosphoesterase [archaeon]|nr:DHH family phosphoesterase [archaeon]MBT4241753.1 DHH family phosphoesterase [archaeon]MBT4418301.1 DHH family phosphoesterase [archaeon]